MTDRKSTAQLHAERLLGRQQPATDRRPSWERHAERLRPTTTTDDTNQEDQ
ncbi:hypothetical protein [Kitasatospora terrestris]|uniref:Uncharacterized protein n=1 Tax=Kitasatospora terrestris TaxID=258051 RepID=A0ABP9E4R8_9ACTN